MSAQPIMCNTNAGCFDSESEPILPTIVLETSPESPDATKDLIRSPTNWVTNRNTRGSFQSQTTGYEWNKRRSLRST